MLPQQHKVVTAQQGTVEKSLRYSMLCRNFLNPGLAFSLEMLMVYSLLTALEITLC